MGCDLHLYVEAKENGRWVSKDSWEPDENDGCLTVPWGKMFHTGRNYSLFAILANVRNGRGFSGIDTGDGFVPILTVNRGVPDDADLRCLAEVKRWGNDGHSHSWLTVQELLDYDWTRTTKHRGYLSMTNYADWVAWRRGHGEGPEGYCGGGNSKIITEDEMMALIDAKGGVHEYRRTVPKDYFGGPYCVCEWTLPYHKSCVPFWGDVMPRLLRLGKPEDVRIVFFFDN